MDHGKSRPDGTPGIISLSTHNSKQIVSLYNLIIINVAPRGL